MKKSSLRNLFILLGSTLSVLQGAIITPALPKISEFFFNVGNIEFLTKLIIAIPPLTIALFSPLAGNLLEKYGRKNTLIWASVLYAIMGTTGFYLENIYLILIGRALLGVTISALMSGFIVVLGDLYKGKELNKYMGIQGALMSFAGMIFLLLGGKLTLISWKYPFLVYAFSLIIAAGSLSFLKETKPSISAESGEKNRIEEKSQFSRAIWTLNITAFLLWLLTYYTNPTAFFAKKNFKLEADKIGVYMALWILISSIASITYSTVRRFFSFQQIYVLGFLLWATGFFLLYFSQSATLILSSLAFAGAGNGFVIPNLKTELLELLSPKQSKHSGILTASLYLGQFFSPIFVQPIIYFSGIQMPFLIFSIFILLISLFYLWSIKSKS